MSEVFETGSIETGSNVNSLNEASEQEMVRVRESMQKAQQLGAQIRDDQKKNAHLAQFLTYLFNTVNDEEIRTISVELFSRPDQTGLSMTLAIYEMLALFLPFYTQKTHESGLATAFEAIRYEIALAADSYLEYIQLLYRTYPLYQQLDKDTLSSLIAALLLYHGIVVIEEGKTSQDLVNHIRRSLP